MSGDKNLERRIIDRIEAEGPIAFADFMEAALYDPKEGYYSSGRQTPGFEGDYFTSPSFSPAFGMTLARFFPLVDDALGAPDIFQVVEFGANEGRLAKQILDALRDNFLNIYERTRYICIERGEASRKKGAEACADHDNIEWASDISGIKPADGLVISNEFFDALPTHRVVMRDDGLREIMVGVKDGKFTQTEATPTNKQFADYFRLDKIDLAPGQEAEVCLEAEKWIKDIACVIDRGAMVTIDYGYPAYELYGHHRKRGTLLAYKGHSVAEDYFDDVGKQDLTAHVNFTALVRWGLEAAMEPVAFTDQLRFFIELGIHEVFAQIEAASTSYSDFQAAVQSAKALVMPGGMGETFKVLIQQKGLGEEAAESLKAKISTKYKFELP